MLKALKLALAALLAASAFTAASEARVDRVRIGRIVGYTSIDDRHVLLRDIGTRRILITLRRSCRGFGTASRITASFGDHETIVTPRQEWISAGSGNCQIANMEMVEDIDAARALIAEREDQ
jgi:hypothetical protein